MAPNVALSILTWPSCARMAGTSESISSKAGSNRRAGAGIVVFLSFRGCGRTSGHITNAQTVLMPGQPARRQFCSQSHFTGQMPNAALARALEARRRFIFRFFVRLWLLVSLRLLCRLARPFEGGAIHR